MIIYLAMIDSPEGRHKFEFIYNRYKKPDVLYSEQNIGRHTGF